VNPELQQIAIDIAQSPKTAATVSAGTMGVGLGTAFEWIQSNIGTTASLVGLVLSCVLIYTSIQKERRENRKHKAELKKLSLETEILKSSLN